VGPVPDPLLRKSRSAGNQTRTSGSVARISDHLTTEAVIFSKHLKIQLLPQWKLTTSLLHISLRELLSCTHEAEWTPFQTHYFSEILGALGIEPRKNRCSLERTPPLEGGGRHDMPGKWTYIRLNCIPCL
jgi:hypothetical protein